MSQPLATMITLDIIQRRRSVRSYKTQPLAPELRTEVESIVQRQAPGFFGNTPHFSLVERDRARHAEKVKLGTYGFIQGAPYFIAGAIERKPQAEVDFGYLAEHIVLEMTRLGLGTCWLGGTFSREEFAKVMHLEGTSWIPATLALGYPAEKSLMEKAVRWGSKAGTRLPWSDLFFDDDFSRPLTKEAAGQYADVLDMVRRGPSASNKQPWRFLKDNAGFHLFLVRTPGYRKWVPSTDLQMIDMGIAMRHFDAAAGARGLSGRWEILPHDAQPTEGTEYIVSWVI